MSKASDERNIHQRLLAVMDKVKYIQKEQKKGMQYSIVSHDAVTAKVRPALVAEGIVYYPVSIQRNQDGNRTEVDLVLRFVNTDNPTDYIDVPGIGYGIDPQDKGPGKAVSYAVKYCLLKALGLETGDDPDHDSIPHEPEAEHAIGPQQVETLNRLIAETDTDTVKFCRAFKIGCVEELPATKFPTAKQKLEAKKNKGAA